MNRSKPAEPATAPRAAPAGDASVAGSAPAPLPAVRLRLVRLTQDLSAGCATDRPTPPVANPAGDLREWLRLCARCARLLAGNTRENGTSDGAVHDPQRPARIETETGWRADMAIPRSKVITGSDEGTEPMDDKDAFRQKLQAQLDQWKAEIDKLEAKASAASADARLKYQEELKELRARQEDAREKMEEFRKSSGEAWKDLADGMKSAWDDFGSAVRRAADRFG